VSLAIVWFRRDLRLVDNPALAAALEDHARVLPVYLHSPGEEAPWSPGAASKWWLHHALADLEQRLSGRLLLLPVSDSLAALRDLIERSSAAAVYWNRLYEPAVVTRDTRVKQVLRSEGLTVQSFNAALLVEPWEVSTKQGRPFRVFTPFWKHLLAAGVPHQPVRVPDLGGRLIGQRAFAALQGVELDELGLLPEIAWDAGIANTWLPTRAAAEARLEEFLAFDIRRYPSGRDLPAKDQVSRLSPYLHFGQLGPREVTAACHAAKDSAAEFLREMGWREFAHHLLYHFPYTADSPMDGRFDAFPWREDESGLSAWQRGETGIPMVDAGMRQLWESGWMHNRVRMIVASFLTKNLLLPWQSGARWFWDTLVDADLASNSLGWQWTAGCGADAAPFFRVFNPVLQGQKFDPYGAYVRRWLPQLSKLPDKWVHQPWLAPAEVLAGAGLVLGKDYPQPVVDLRASRLRALEIWGRLK
jgi:deoxyribodipyrimidine photo-lyase